MKVVIEGWHIHPEAAVCSCGNPAHVVARFEDDYDVFDLCNDCLQNHEIVSDRVNEVFKNLGL